MPGKWFSRSSWRDEIMRQFEHPPFMFPMIPPGDWSHARARLSAFRSDNEWLVVFEIFGFNVEASACETQTHAFGNKLRRNKYLTWGPGITLTNNQGEPLSLDSADVLRNLDPANFWGKATGKIYHFAPTPTDYAELGISLSSDTLSESDDVAAVHSIATVLRYIAYRYPDIVFYSARDLLASLDRPESLPLFLQTFDWHHPYEHVNDTPSNSPCLQSLALALAENNPSAFQCPETTWNTRWSHWPEWPN